MEVRTLPRLAYSLGTKKLRLKYWNFQWYQNCVSLAARYRWWSKVDVAPRIQEKQSHICIGKYRSQCRPVQEMPVQLHNSTSVTWDSWEQLFISLYFQNSDQALSWPTVQFSSVFLILFIPFMPVETLKASHFTATVKYTWGPLCLCSLCIQGIFLLGISWLSETLSAFLSLSWDWSNQLNSLFLFLTCDGSRVLLFFCLYLSIFFIFKEIKLIYLGQKLSQRNDHFLIFLLCFIFIATPFPFTSLPF